MAINRRAFVVRTAAAGAGLLIGVRFPGELLGAQENEKAAKKPTANPLIHAAPA